MSDEFADAKEQLIAIVATIDPTVNVVIPTRATEDAFRISLSKGPHRRFISLSEDDMLDLVESTGAATRIRAALAKEIAELG